MEDGIFELDVNNDNKKDFRFVTLIQTSIFFSGEKRTIMQIIDTSFQILVDPQIAGKKVTTQSNWANEKVFNLAYRSGAYSLFEEYNNWSDFKYLAFRRVTPNETLFGWVKLNIVDYNNLTIDSYSMQKLK